MEKKDIQVLAVDDDEINLEILAKSLKNAGYSYRTFLSSTEAWEYISKNPEEFHVALLDRMMPDMNGIEMLQKMKASPELRHIPVIIQTGNVGVQESIEGLKAGAYYYLGKPFDTSMMVALVNSAVRDIVIKRIMPKDASNAKEMLHHLKEGSFTLKTPEEAVAFVGAMVLLAHDPDKVAKGLLELLLNAIEHGNLGIGYDEKAKLIIAESFDQEVKRRLELPENAQKNVVVRFQRKEENIVLIIIDEGKGFKWQEYLNFEPLRLMDPNGRGIALARTMGIQFDYTGGGNQVVCSFKKAKN